MEIDWKSIMNLNGFTKKTFDTFTDDWQNIELRATNDGRNCYIHEKDNKMTIINDFKLSDKPSVNIYCSWKFYKNNYTNKFIARPTFYKLKANGDYQTQSQEKEKIIVDLDDGVSATKYWEMMSFILGFNELIDTGEFNNNYGVVSKDQIITTLGSYDTDEQIQTIKDFINKNELSYQQLEKLLDRSKEKALEKFREMLNSKDTKEDTWQHFFETNLWIFAGISLKLFFLKGHISQANIGLPNTQGHGAPRSDILCIDDYTTLVELKKHTTPIFTNKPNTTARTNTWSFSSDFIDGISQCLGQKQDLLEICRSKEFTSNDGKYVEVLTQDPKVVFIIGNKESEFPQNATVNNRKKANTFERYRRDCRNIEIITYDELYARAEYMVNSMRN